MTGLEWCGRKAGRKCELAAKRKAKKAATRKAAAKPRASKPRPAQAKGRAAEDREVHYSDLRKVMLASVLKRLK